MPQSFAIAASSQIIELKKNERQPSTGTAGYIITNKTSSPVRGRTKVVALGNSKTEWFNIDSKNLDRTYNPNESHTIDISISIPEKIPGGSYQFRLDAFSEENPEEDYTEGQVVSLVLNNQKKSSIPWWTFLVIAGVLLTGLVIALIMLFTPKKIKVPDVTGLAYLEAATFFTNIKLTDSIAPGVLPPDTNDWIVESQIPPAESKVKKNTSVILNIKSGIEVPNVIGFTEERGKDSLIILGFIALKSGERDTGAGTPGTIVELQPPAGSIVNSGDTISYFTKQQISVNEDCLGFQPARVNLVNEGSQVLMSDGFSRMKMFPNRTEAEIALQIIRHYSLSQHCFVGRPDPAVEYWKINGKAPEGTMPGEDCVSFDPDNLTIRQTGSLFLLLDGNHSMLSFPNQNEAETTRKIIQKYGFNRLCFVGRPGPSMTYFRK